MGSLVLTTGFGPFEEHTHNPSEEVARGLAEHPPAGVEVVAAVLPVSFRRAPAEFERALRAVPTPDLVLLLGVHAQPGWRLEARARMHLVGRGRPDGDGVDAADAECVRPPAARPEGQASPRAQGGTAERFSSLDVGALALSLAELAPEPVQLSWNAGGYVCERTYGQALALTEDLRIPTLFVHVPRARFCAVPDQVRRLGELIGWILGR